jgi:hypothetical protein
MKCTPHTVRPESTTDAPSVAFAARDMREQRDGCGLRERVWWWRRRRRQRESHAWASRLGEQHQQPRANSSRRPPLRRAPVAPAASLVLSVPQQRPLEHASKLCTPQSPEHRLLSAARPLSMARAVGRLQMARPAHTENWTGRDLPGSLRRCCFGTTRLDRRSESSD